MEAEPSICIVEKWRLAKIEANLFVGQLLLGSVAAIKREFFEESGLTEGEIETIALLINLNPKATATQVMRELYELAS